MVLGDDAWQMMDFDPNTTVEDVFKQIGNHVGRTFSPDNFSLVMESPDHPDPVTLEIGHAIRDFVNSDNVSIRIIIIYIYFQLM